MPGSYIEEWKEEHIAIKNRLLDVKRQGVHTMEGRNALLEGKRLLLSHCRKEDEILYPALRKAVGKDGDLKALVDSFESEMKEITAFCTDFFDKYSTGGGGIEFFRDFDKFYNLLENRIQKEENTLFPRFERL